MIGNCVYSGVPRSECPVCRSTSRTVDVGIAAVFPFVFAWAAATADSRVIAVTYAVATGLAALNAIAAWQLTKERRS